jgi:two-component system NarL family sensor kinase
MVRLTDEDHTVVLTVEDDGVGFDPAVLPGRVAEGHIGLASQQERVQSAGGRLAIRSAPGEGTKVEVEIPA